MSGDEAREAMKRAAPVLCNGFGSIDGRDRLYEYTCITAVILRHVEGQERVSVELQDRCGNSSAIVDAKHVSLKG